MIHLTESAALQVIDMMKQTERPDDPGHAQDRNRGQAGGQRQGRRHRRHDKRGIARRRCHRQKRRTCRQQPDCQGDKPPAQQGEPRLVGPA